MPLESLWAGGTQRYQPTQRNDEDALTRAIITLADRYGRYGYLRITIKLREAGWNVGKDRVERIWRREGLNVPQKQKPRGRLRPEHQNHVWSYDFVSTFTHDGRTVPSSTNTRGSAWPSMCGAGSTVQT
jgi:putative transposase